MAAASHQLDLNPPPDATRAAWEPWLEHGLLPDWLLRRGIRRLLRRRLDELRAPGAAARRARLRHHLDHGPLALETAAANAQHYELPAEFFGLVLGPHRKYSCAWFEGSASLAEAEAAMLQRTCRRARLEEGQDVLELGCGWGSLSLYAAARFPRSRILAVSNAAAQRRYIEAEAARRGLPNLEVVTADINHFEPRRRFDRVVSVEMFEHLRNHRALMRRLARWSNPGALLFIHVFAHRRHAYLFEDGDASDWMARHFFTGGMMPSLDLLPRAAAPWRLQQLWRVGGLHYQATALAWLRNLDAHRREVLALFRRCYGSEAAARRWWWRWRLFFLACAEMFGCRGGREWMVAHYRFGLQGETL